MRPLVNVVSLEEAEKLPADACVWFALSFEGMAHLQGRAATVPRGKVLYVAGATAGERSRWRALVGQWRAEQESAAEQQATRTVVHVDFKRRMRA